MTWNQLLRRADEKLLRPELRGPWRCGKCPGLGGIFWLAFHRHEHGPLRIRRYTDRTPDEKRP